MSDTTYEIKEDKSLVPAENGITQEELNNTLTPYITETELNESLSPYYNEEKLKAYMDSYMSTYLSNWKKENFGTGTYNNTGSFTNSYEFKNYTDLLISGSALQIESADSGHPFLFEVEPYTQLSVVSIYEESSVDIIQEKGFMGVCFEQHAGTSSDRIYFNVNNKSGGSIAVGYIKYDTNSTPILGNIGKINNNSSAKVSVTKSPKNNVKGTNFLLFWGRFFS